MCATCRSKRSNPAPRRVIRCGDDADEMAGNEAAASRIRPPYSGVATGPRAERGSRPLAAAVAKVWVLWHRWKANYVTVGS